MNYFLSGDDSLQAEIHSSLHSSKKTSKADSFKESEVSDSDTDLPAMGSSAYRKAARTFRAIQASTRPGIDSQGSADTSKAVGGSIFQSYTISRENSFSPDEEEFEEVQGRKKEEAGEVSDDSGTGRSTGLSRPDSLASSAPKEELARELLRAATKNQWTSKAEPATLPRASKQKQYAEDDVEVVEVQTVGVLQRPSFNISSSLLHSVPLGTVPGKSAPTTPGQERKQIVGHPSMGVIPGKSFAENLQPSSHKPGSDFDETEPLGELTTTIKCSAADVDPSESFSLQEDFDETEPLTNTTSSLAWDAWEPSFQGGHPSLGSVPGGHPGLGSLPGSYSGGHPGLGSVPGGHPSLGSVPGGHPGLGSIPGSHPGLGSVPSGHPGLGMVPGGHPGLGSVPGYNSDPMTAQSSLNSGTTMTSSSGRPNDLGVNRCWSQNAESVHMGEPSKPRESSKFNDSGVMSGDYSEELGSSSQRIDRTIDIDAMSDGGFSDIGNYPGIRVPSKESSEPLSLEVESALRHLNPADVERRRKLMGRNYRLATDLSINHPNHASLCSYDLEYDDLGSPGVIAGVDEYFKSLPYGVDRPASGLETSDANRSGRNSSATSYRNRRLPEKLRIVKPLEGSLTLHQWSRLATPHLGGVLEERVGIAMKGNSKHGLDPLFDMYQLEEEEEEDEDMVVPRQMPAAQTFNTLTNSTVLHPDTTTFCTSTYGRSQMSSGLPSRVGSRQSSRPASMQGSFSDLPSLFRDTNPTIGLNKLIGDRKISGARRSQLDISAMSAISSLTPSVLTSPTYSRNMSPTDTPCHTPEESLPGSPEDNGDAGIVYGFFNSLKTAIYGQQRKEHRQSKREKRMQDKRHKLRIMEAVEEVGVENILSEKEGTPLSMPSLSALSSGNKPSKKKGPPVPMGLSDFDARYLGALDDFDELKDITPGTLTLTSEAPRDPMDYTEEWIGQLTVPSFSSLGRPSLNSVELGKVPAHEEVPHGPAFASPRLGGRGPGRIVSPGEARPLLGVPGRPGTGALGSKRGDLGTIPGTSDETQLDRPTENRGMVQSTSFVGSITNMFFGRKGGYS